MVIVLQDTVQSLYNTPHYKMEQGHVVAPNFFLPCNFTKVL